MKNIFIICCILFLSLSACSDFLEEENISTATADVLYSTPEGFETLVNSSYTPARFWYGKSEGYSLTEVGTDLFTGAGGDPYPQFRTYDATLQGDHNALAWVWRQLYKGVNTCNAVLDRIEAGPLSPELKKRREGEVRFLRAFYYWHLVETFGAIPLRTSETKVIEVELTKSSVEEIYDLIISDLNLAVTNLEGISKPQGGRVIKPAAEAFLARIYLTRGMYAEAEASAEKVINNYGFSLMKNYRELWDMGNSNGSTNPEVIWFVNYTQDLQMNQEVEGERGLRLWEGGHHGHMVFLPSVVYTDPGLLWGLEYGRPLNQIMPTRHLLDLYDESKDARYHGSFRTVWYANNPNNLAPGMQIGDTAAFATKLSIPNAIEATKKYKIYDRDRVYRANGTPDATRDKFVQLNKFLDPTRAAGGVVESKRDAFVIRLAEVYLIAAEAEMMQNKHPEAADHVNVVRTRAALPGKESEMMITGADLNIDFILDERARELAGEQLRWFDLKRTNKLIDRVKMFNPDGAATIQPYHLVRPIPQSELDAVINKGAFTQNEGYN